MNLEQPPSAGHATQRSLNWIHLTGWVLVAEIVLLGVAGVAFVKLLPMPPNGAYPDWLGYLPLGVAAFIFLIGALLRPGGQVGRAVLLTLPIIGASYVGATLLGPALGRTLKNCVSAAGRPGDYICTFETGSDGYGLDCPATVYGPVLVLGQCSDLYRLGVRADPTATVASTHTAPSPVLTNASDSTPDQSGAVTYDLPLTGHDSFRVCEPTPAVADPASSWMPVLSGLKTIYVYHNGWQTLLDDVHASTFAVSPDGRALAAASDTELVVIGQEGLRQTVLSDERSLPRLIGWPDTRLVLLSGPDAGTFKSLSLSADGSPVSAWPLTLEDGIWQREPPYPLTAPGDWDVELAPTGERFIYARLADGAWPSLALVEPGSRSILAEWFHPSMQSAANRPAWSADSRYFAAILGPTKLAVTTEAMAFTPLEVQRVTAEGRAEPLTAFEAAGRSILLENLSISGRGRYVTVWINQQPGDPMTLLVMDTQERTAWRPCLFSRGSWQPLAWAPDESAFLVGFDGVAGSYELWRVNVADRSVIAMPVPDDVGRFFIPAGWLRP